MLIIVILLDKGECKTFEICGCLNSTSISEISLDQWKRVKEIKYVTNLYIMYMYTCISCKGMYVFLILET